VILRANFARVERNLTDEYGCGIGQVGTTRISNYSSTGSNAIDFIYIKTMRLTLQCREIIDEIEERAASITMRSVQTAISNSIRSFVPSKRKYIYLREKPIDYTRVAYGNKRMLCHLLISRYCRIIAVFYTRSCSSVKASTRNRIRNLLLNTCMAHGQHDTSIDHSLSAMVIIVSRRRSMIWQLYKRNDRLLDSNFLFVNLRKSNFFFLQRNNYRSVTRDRKFGLH